MSHFELKITKTNEMLALFLAKLSEPFVYKIVQFVYNSYTRVPSG